MGKIPHNPESGENCLCFKCSKAWLKAHAPTTPPNVTYDQTWEVQYTVTFTRRIKRGAYTNTALSVVDWADGQANNWANGPDFSASGNVDSVRLVDLDEPETYDWLGRKVVNDNR